MKGMVWYYISRVGVALLFGALALLLGAPPWLASLGTLLVIMAFIVLARSGRYTIRPAHRLAPFARDERGSYITRSAATYAFAVQNILLALFVLLCAYLPKEAFALDTKAVLSLTLAFGFITYYAADIVLRGRS